MKCWQCSKQLDDFFRGAVPFRASCDYCNADLHCCKNCRFYQPGRANDCMIPGTEFVADRSKSNHCEDFALTDPTIKKDKPSISDIEKRLFGD